MVKVMDRGPSQCCFMNTILFVNIYMYKTEKTENLHFFVLTL